MKPIKFLKIVGSSLLFVILRIIDFCVSIRRAYIKRNWYLSKNGNYYNPTLKATVYYGRDSFRNDGYSWWDTGRYSWHVARYNVHHEGYSTESEAQIAAYQMWLERK